MADLLVLYVGLALLALRAEVRPIMPRNIPQISRTDHISKLLILCHALQGLKNISLPAFAPTSVEYGPFCVKQDLAVCYGTARGFRRIGTLLNGSYSAPHFSDFDGDGHDDFIVSHANNSLMIFKG
jgi:hypothetical protein